MVTAILASDFSILALQDDILSNAGMVCYESVQKCRPSVSKHNSAQENSNQNPIDCQCFSQGVAYYGYRYYDPVTGRWPSRDPIEEASSINLYSLVDNTPGNATDLLGLLIYRNPDGTIDRSLAPGQSPANDMELPRIDKCSITIIVSHRRDVEAAASTMFTRFLSKQNNDMTDEFGLKTKNPCAQLMFLSCLPKSAEKSVRNLLRGGEMSHMASMLMSLNFNGDPQMINDADPNANGTNAKSMLEAARKQAKDYAEKAMCGCKCDCSKISVRIQLYGEYWMLKPPNDADQKTLNFIPNFSYDAWKPLFENFDVSCQKYSNDSTSLKLP